MVMDYAPGGDLMGLLISKGRFPENVSKFYVAELLCAFHDLHRNRIIYRDGKPDNVLITGDGHLRLADFGLCCRGALCGTGNGASSGIDTGSNIASGGIDGGLGAIESAVAGTTAAAAAVAAATGAYVCEDGCEGAAPHLHASSMVGT